MVRTTTSARKSKKASDRPAHRAVASLRRAVEIARQPQSPGTHPVIARIGKRLYAAEDTAAALQDKAQMLEAEAEHYRKKTDTVKGLLRTKYYTLDTKAETILRHKTGKTYKLAGQAFGLVQMLFMRHQQGAAPILFKQTEFGGYRRYYDAFRRPKKGDGRAAERDIILIEDDRISLRVP